MKIVRAVFLFRDVTFLLGISFVRLGRSDDLLDDSINEILLILRIKQNSVRSEIYLKKSKIRRVKLFLKRGTKQTLS